MRTRGRGRGRGRGRFPSNRGGRGRGGPSNRGGRSQNRNVMANAITGQIVDDDKLDIEIDAKAFFIGVASFDKHYEAQSKNVTRYAAAMALLAKMGVELSDNAKVRALASAWARSDKDLARCLLKVKNLFGLVEVLKAVSILDSARQIRQLERKMEKYEAINKKAEEEKAKLETEPSSEAVPVTSDAMEVDGEKGKNKKKQITIVKKKTISKTKVKIDNLKNIKPSCGTVSGALCREIRRWASTFSKEELEFFALHMPTAPWKKLADVVHFNSTDFVNAPWFLKYCYGEAPPDDTVLQRTTQINKDTVNSIVEEVAVPFTHVRQYQNELTNAAKANIVRNEDKIDRGIWWYEELQCAEVDQAIIERFEKNEELTLNYGKLMERLITFKKMKSIPPFYPRLMAQAESKMESMKLNLDAPIVVMADASSSMSVAIETATIISSLLTAFTDAELIFFNNNYWYPEKQPRSIEDVINLALKTKANNCTSHAAALWPYYEGKKIIKTLICVTDEEENTAYKGHMFEGLYQKYLNEVNSACQLVFVSFLRSQTDEGQMVKKLRKHDFPCMQLAMSRTRPDLTKLDNLLGQLSARASDFTDELMQMQSEIEKNGLDKVFTELFTDSLQAKMMA